MQQEGENKGDLEDREEMELAYLDIQTLETT
jgi:hypothetical protein